MTTAFARNMRANVVLIGTVFALAVAVILVLAVVSRLAGWHATHLADQAIAVVLALLAYLITRWKARRAFDDGRRAGHLILNRGRAELIDDHPEGWLIQLYVELHAKRLHIDQFVERPH